MPSWRDEVASNLSHIDVGFVLRTFYLGTAAAILVAYKIPTLKGRFLAYGARSAVNKRQPGAAPRDANPKRKSPSLPFTYGSGRLSAVFDFLAVLQVPHSGFMSFYCVSVASSIVCGVQLFIRGFVYQNIAD